MSYVRFSSDDHRSDVYCYEAVGDVYTLHVAARRVEYQEELPPPLPVPPRRTLWDRLVSKTRRILKKVRLDFLLPKSRFERFIDAYLKRHQRISELFEKSPLVKIGLKSKLFTYRK